MRTPTDEKLMAGVSVWAGRWYVGCNSEPLCILLPPPNPAPRATPQGASETQVEK
jgi:hypothetical protein